VVTMTIPGVGAAIWFGLVPVGPPTGTVAEKAVFVFVMHPATAAFLSYLLCSVFLTALDSKRPWRPFRVVAPTVGAVFVSQVGYPSLCLRWVIRLMQGARLRVCHLHVPSFTPRSRVPVRCVRLWSQVSLTSGAQSVDPVLQAAQHDASAACHAAPLPLRVCAGPYSPQPARFRQIKFVRRAVLLNPVCSMQILFPGLIVLFEHPFEVLALPSLAATIAVTLWGIRRAPASWLGPGHETETEKLAIVIRTFTKISLLFLFYTVRPCFLHHQQGCEARQTAVHSSRQS
jgi:hypothetical protein